MAAKQGTYEVFTPFAMAPLAELLVMRSSFGKFSEMHQKKKQAR